MIWLWVNQVIIFVLEIVILSKVFKSEKDRGSGDQKIANLEKELFRFRDRFHDLESSIRRAQISAFDAQEQLKKLQK